MSYNVADMECDLCLKRNQFFIQKGEVPAGLLDLVRTTCHHPLQTEKKERSLFVEK